MKCIKIDTNKLVPLQPYKVDFKELVEELIGPFESDGNIKTVSPIDIKQESGDKYSVLMRIDTALLCHIYGRETLAYLWENLSETQKENDPELAKQFANSRLNLQRTREIGIYNLQDLLDMEKMQEYIAQQHSDVVKKQVRKRLVEYLGVG